MLLVLSKNCLGFFWQGASFSVNRDIFDGSWEVNLWRNDCQQMACSYRRMHPKPEVSLTTPNDKIILRPKRKELFS